MNKASKIEGLSANFRQHGTRRKRVLNALEKNLNDIYQNVIAALEDAVAEKDGQRIIEILKCLPQEGDMKPDGEIISQLQKATSGKFLDELIQNGPYEQALTIAVFTKNIDALTAISQLEKLMVSDPSELLNIVLKLHLIDHLDFDDEWLRIVDRLNTQPTQIHDQRLIGVGFDKSGNSIPHIFSAPINF